MAEGLDRDLVDEILEDTAEDTSEDAVETKTVKKSGDGEIEIEGAENTETETPEETAESPETEDTAETESTPEPEKKGFFGRKKDKDKKDKRDEIIDDLTDRVKRNMAEFDNFRKRTEKEKTAMYEVGAKSIIEKMLPVIDNFERGLNTVPEEEKGTPFADGMDKIYKQLVKTLEESGVEPIAAVGQPFDPNLHNAVMHVEDESFEDNVVTEEFQKGYTYRGSVVRHSMVKVAN